MIDTKLLRKLLRKTDLVTYVWDSARLELRCAEYLEDSDDRRREFLYITDQEYQRYNKKFGVYLYHEVRHQFKLLACVTETDIIIY